MAIPCPGSESYSHIFGVGRDGANPFAAFLRAFLVLLLEIANSRGLRRFLNKKCDPPCLKVVGGPTFSNFTVRIVPKAGGIWHCVMGGTLEAKIECQEITTVAIDISDKQLLEGILAELRNDEKGGHKRKA